MISAEKKTRPIHHRLYLTLAILTAVLSLADYAYTMFGMGRVPGMEEGNPFFSLLLDRPWMAVVYKVVVIPGAMWVMYRFRERPVARFGLWLCCGVYVGLTVKAAYMLITYRQYFFS